MLYEAEAVAGLQAQLAELRPLPPTHLSGKAVIEHLAATIEELQSRGIPLKRVTAQLRELGKIQLKDTTVAVYLRAMKPKRRGKRAGMRAVGEGGGKRPQSAGGPASSEAPRDAAIGLPVASAAQSFPATTSITPAPVSVSPAAPKAAPPPVAHHASEQAPPPHHPAEREAPSDDRATHPPVADSPAPAGRPAPAPAVPINRGGFDLRPDRRSRRDQAS
jgi:hypothetical protein